MADMLELVARLQAFSQGRAVRIAATRQVALQPDALVICPLMMAGEDTTIHIVAFGKPGQRARILWVPDPRFRDDQYQLFRQLGRWFEQACAEARSSGAFPQIIVSSTSAAELLDHLAERLRYNHLDVGVRRFGELLSYASDRYPVAGQQALHTATKLLQIHWATGQEGGEDEHLGALLAWIEPPTGMHVLAAVREAERVPMGVKTDPALDLDHLAPLVVAYNNARHQGASATALQHRSELIRAVLEPVVQRIYAATQRAIGLVQALELPPLPGLESLEASEVQEFDAFMRSRDLGFRLALRDGAKAAAFKLAAREDSTQVHEAALRQGDAVWRARARLEGRVIAGRIANPSSGATGESDFFFELVTNQQGLRVRPRDELSWIEDERLRVAVVASRREVGGSRLRLRLVAGHRVPGVPSEGSVLELTPLVPDWGRVWRTRKHLKTALARTPWTHAVVCPPRPRTRTAPPDPLAAVEALR